MPISNFYLLRLAEYPEHEIEVQYALLLKIIYNTIFYSPILPIGNFITLIFLMIYYWSEKLLIAKERSFFMNLDYRMAQDIT